MKNKIRLALLFFLVIYVSTTYSISSAKETVEYKIPTINILTETMEDPTYDTVTAPAGCAGAGITNNSYVACNIKYYDSSNTNTVDESAKIKVRGNTSAYVDKKPFTIKFSKKKKFEFCNGKGTKKWLLLACGTSLNYFFCNVVSSLCGMEWQPEFQYVNLEMNGTSRGTYILCESADTIVNALDFTDDSFMIENDAYWWNTDVSFETSYNKSSSAPLRYTFKYPDNEDLTTDSVDSIKNYMETITSILSDSSDSYLNYIDVNSFASWFIAKDYFYARDTWGSNMFYFKKNSSDKLHMGPTWDFDNTYYTNPTKFSLSHSSSGLVFAEYLFNRESFKKAYRNQFEKNRDIYTKIQTLVKNYLSIYGPSLQESWDNDALIWDTTSKNVTSECNELLSIFAARTTWIDNTTSDWSLDFTQYKAALAEAATYDEEDYPNYFLLEKALETDVYTLDFTQEELDSVTENIKIAISQLSTDEINLDGTPYTPIESVLPQETTPSLETHTPTQTAVTPSISTPTSEVTIIATPVVIEPDVSPDIHTTPIPTSVPIKTINVASQTSVMASTVPTIGSVFKTDKFIYKIVSIDHNTFTGAVKTIGLTDYGKHAKTLKTPKIIIDEYNYNYKVKKLKKAAFKKAKSKKITLNKYIVKIPKLCFNKCKNLKKLIIKGKLKKVAKNAFNKCNTNISIKGKHIKNNSKLIKKVLK